MDDKESEKQAKTKGDSLVWFIQDLPMYLYRKKRLILATEQWDDYLERKGPKPNPAYSLGARGYLPGRPMVSSL